jgi:hypothetical protein
MCLSNISCSIKIGTGGLSKHIKSKHQGHMKLLPASLGGTVDVDIGGIATLWTKSSPSMDERMIRRLESTSKE